MSATTLIGSWPRSLDDRVCHEIDPLPCQTHQMQMNRCVASEPYPVILRALPWSTAGCHPVVRGRVEIVRPFPASSMPSHSRPLCAQGASGGSRWRALPSRMSPYLVRNRPHDPGPHGLLRSTVSSLKVPTCSKPRSFNSATRGSDASSRMIDCAWTASLLAE